MRLLALLAFVVEPSFSLFQGSAEGLTSHGFVTGIKDFGLLVEFYNNVHGLVPIYVFACFFKFFFLLFCLN